MSKRSSYAGGDAAGGRLASSLHVSARELLEAVPDAIVGTGRDGIVAFVNAQAETMFGYERGELLGSPIELLLPGRLRDAHVRHRAEFQARPTTRPMGAGLDLLARRRDGTEFPVEISLSPLATVDGLQIISVVRDVSQRRENERERERLLEVAELALTEAEKALHIRVEAERLKDDLTNMVVHDLKNPVNGIAMTMQLLLRRGDLTEGQRDSVARVARTCSEMLRLVANVLEIAKIEAGEMPVSIEPIILAELVDEVAAEYGPVASDVGRRLEVAVPTDLPPARGDRRLLKRVMVNLVVNALRHSRSSEIRVEAATQSDRLLALRVVDRGHGIAPADQATIFEKFKTGGDSSADTGLGLPFCKLAVERMHGRIALQSARDTGTAFTVTLPRADV